MSSLPDSLKARFGGDFIKINKERASAAAQQESPMELEEIEDLSSEILEP